MENKEFNFDWLATLLFCLLLGIFGAHRFYTGKNDTAIAMVLISVLLGWFFGIGVTITGIWATIDLILIICQKFTDKNNKPITWYITKDITTEVNE